MMDNIETSIFEESKLASYLEHNSNLQHKTNQIRDDLTTAFPFLHRLALAIYHTERDAIQTYVYDEDLQSNLRNYETALSECASLQKLATEMTERIVHDLSLIKHERHQHTRVIREAGYLSSYTIPLLMEGRLLGFIFFNSREKHVFKGEVLQHLRSISMIFTLLLQQELTKDRVLKSAIESMNIVSQHRDPETGEHLQRMARYSLLIAREVAPVFELTDIMINDIYLYAPLHDLGKLMIPDKILLKEGPLTQQEFSIMQEHTVKGYELAEKLMNVHHLSESPNISILTSIIRSHHEKLDGTGYPDGLTEQNIPIAARIVAVADIFDALTSNRPYKKAWTIEKAFTELKKVSGIKLDSNCVDALIKNRQEVMTIQASFHDKEE